MIARRALLLAAAAFAATPRGAVAADEEVALDVESAEVFDDPATGRVAVLVRFAPSAHGPLGDFSMMHLSEEVEILLEGRLIMSPFVREPIRNGIILVQGGIERMEANDIVRALRKPGARLVVRTKR